LDVVAVALGEERPNWPVGEAHRQDGRLRWARLALDEAARDLARGVHPLLVIDGEREEVESLAGLLGDRRGEHDRVTESNQDGAIGLLGQLARLQREALTADLALNLD